jgi:uncharacterized protein involved in exopolysaccharide biosynthesis
MSESTMIETYPQRSLRDFYYVLFRHKRKVILFFLAVMVVVTAGTFLTTEIYRSEARIMIRIGRESVTLPATATPGSVISYGLDREREINSELEILKSRELAEKVVDEIGPQFFLARYEDLEFETGLAHAQSRDNPTKRDKAITQFVEHLKIEPQKISNILMISYEGYSPRQTQQTLAKLVDFYHEKHIAAHRTPGSYEIFDKEVQQLHSQLIQGEEDLKNLKKNKGAASLVEQRKIVLEQIGGLQREFESTEAALAASQARVQELEEKLAGLSPTVVTHHTKISNYGTELMRGKLYELKLKEQELLTKYTETSTPVREIRRQIAEAQDLLDKEDNTRTETTTGINGTYEEVKRALLMEMATLPSLKSKLEVVDGQLKEARRQTEDLIITEAQMANLERELVMVDAKYRKYSENLEQARIEQALEMKKISNISVIQPATASMTPVRPRKAVNLGLGLLFGILGGIGLAFFSHVRDHSLKTPQDIEEKLGLKALASIPCLEK